MHYTSTTIIVSIYNNIKALELVLDSLQNQTYKNFDIIISEDAEHHEVKDFLENYHYNGSLTHLHHPDIGWQKNLALNKAIQTSDSDYLIFVDGDCILHPHFVEYHLKYASPKSIMAGKRIKLDQITSEKIVNKELPVEKLNSYILKNFNNLKKQGALFIEEGIFINPNRILGWLPGLRSMKNLKGCNMSFPKKAIEAINGFDEDYIKPAIGEDIDLTWRFKEAGYNIKSVRNISVQYHIWHKENWTDQSENILIMNKKKKLHQYVCKNGLQKLD